MKAIWFGLAAAIALLTPAAGWADITFSYVTDQASYSGSGAITANVYLQEVDTGGSQSLSQQSTVTGTFSYGFYLTQTGGSQTSPSTITNYTSNSAFGQNQSSSTAASLPPNSFDFTATQPFGTTAGQKLTPVTGSPGVYQLLVGTLTLNGVGPTTFSLTSQNNPSLLDPGDGNGTQSDNTFTLPSGQNAAYDLDAGGTQSGVAGSFTFNGTNSQVYTFTVNAVPEPSSMLLCGLAVCGGGIAAYRRKKAGAAKVALA